MEDKKEKKTGQTSEKEKRIVNQPLRYRLMKHTHTKKHLTDIVS